MKRILIFSLNYFPYVGGAEVAIKEITDRCTDEYEFHLLVPRYDSLLPKEERRGKVFIHRILLSRPGATITDQGRFPLKLNKYLYQFRAARYAHRLHQTYHFSMVWGMMAHAVGIPASMFKKRHPDVPYLLTLQEGDPPVYIERLMRPVWPLFRAGFVRADVLQAISSYLLSWGRRMGFRGTGVVIPNGVDALRFSTPVDPDRLRLLKNQLGKKEGDIYLVTTSRLVHKNALDEVIRALTLLPETVTFLVYGIGPEEHALSTLAHRLGVEKRVRFMGHVAYEDIPYVLAASDIFIRPSRSEGMGNSFIEAMAAGLPVIATQEGGIADFLFDAKRNPEKETTGWAVDVDSPEHIARAVNDIIAHPEVVKEVTRRARTLVQEKYDWTIIARDMQALFEDLVSTPSGTVQ